MKISQRNLGAIFSWANSRARTGNPPPHPKAPLCLTTDVLQDGLRGMLGWWHEIRGALPSKLPHLEEEESGRGPHLRCGAASRRWRKQAGAKTASQGHMLLYIPIRITLLWNVRKCVVSASASPRPHGPTQSTWSPLPHPGLAPTGILTKKGRASKSCLEFSPHPFSPSWGFILHPRIRHTDCGPQVPSVAVPPPQNLAPLSRTAHITWRFVTRSALTIQAPSSCPFAPERCFCQPNWTRKPSCLAVSLSFIITGV